MKDYTNETDHTWSALKIKTQQTSSKAQVQLIVLEQTDHKQEA